MKARGSRLAGWLRMILPIVLLALLWPTGGTLAAGPDHAFPAFTEMPGVSVRGVAVDKVGNVFVSVGEIRSSLEYIQVRKFTPAGDQLFSVEVGQGTIGGLAVTANGDLYVAVAAGAGRGVYRTDRAGRTELVPGTNQIFFPNGLAFDDVGTLYVTESVSLGPPPSFGPGGIWRVRRGETAELVLRDPLLTGTRALNQPVPIGANGIAYYHGDLYVTNTEKGTVLRMPVSPDGSIGVPEVWTTLQEVPESPLAWARSPVAGDGIALDVHGNLYVAVLTRSAIVRLDFLDKSQETVAAFRVPDNLPLYAGLDFPASLVFGTGGGERMSLFVTNLGLGRTVAPALPWVGSSLVRIDAGVPGRPIH